MSFPRYPEYKDSGVEWLGEVPAHWEVSPLKHLARIGNGSTPSREQPAYWTGGVYPWLNSSTVNQESITESDQFVTELALTECHLPKIVPPAVLIGITGQGRTRGMASTLLFEATISQHIAYVQPSSLKVSVGWLRRVIDSNYKLLRDESEAGGSTKGAITCEQISLLRVPLPPPAEQAFIAAFLDREAVKIDALVAEQQRLIELLKEKRQSVISHAVTKGLNPQAPMKPSGVEWLGEVPAHWEVRRIKHLVRTIEQGWSPQCEGVPADIDNEWGVLKVGCVNGGTFDPFDNKLLPSEMEPIPALSIRGGDLLVSRANTRDLVGSAAVAERDYPRLMLCDKLYRIRFFENVCWPEFVCRYLATGVVRAQIELAATGASSSMLNIGQSAIMDLVMAVPPLEEQGEIVAYFELEFAKLDNLIAEAQRAIDLLQERRTALISAAVTGQIDVRAIADRAAA